jgi:hypothetical protein
MIPICSMRRRHISVAIACAILGLITYFSTVELDAPRITWNGADNSTLGFGGIFVLTENTHTWRVQGLRKAAELVGLELTVPVQTPKSVKDVHNYLKTDKLESHVDSVKATLNYINLLQQFIDTGSETALFVEDDVDFSIMIKAQMSTLAATLSESEANTNDPVDPYRKANWDVLWLGHFGIEFTEQTRISHYEDPHALPWKALTSTFNNYYQQQEATESQSGSSKQQVAHKVAPLSTYAWATTRSHAQWLLEELGSTPAEEFDVYLHIQCRGLRQRCVAPIPELMHHHKVSGSKSIGKPGIPSSTEGLTWWQSILSKMSKRKTEGLGWWRDTTKHTYNIEWSARCNAAESGKRLGDRWQCLPKDEHAEI